MTKSRISIAFLAALMSACYVEGGTTTYVERDDAVVTLYNYTPYVMYTFYATPCNTSTWGRDMLVGDVVLPDEAVSVRLMKGCWDFMAEGGDTGYDVFWERYNVTILHDQSLSWEPIGGY